MKAVLFGVLALTAVAYVAAQATSAGTAASCDAQCAGNTGVSCLYCPSCGSCDSVGVIDHCYAAGTAMLSIDDGPNEFTARQLDILKRLGIKASFWLVGSNINADLSYPALVKRIADEGHMIGTHTQTHVSLNSITADAVTAEMTQSVNAIQAAAPGYTVKYMRPPNGELNTAVRTKVQGMGLMPIMWNTDTQDLLYGASADNMINNVTSKLLAYSRSAHSLIILMHGKFDFATNEIERIVKYVQLAGYKWVEPATCFDATTAGPKANSTEPVQCVHPPTSMGFQGCSTSFGCANVAGGSCCSHYQSCGTGSTFCGVGCLNGACDVCVQGGYVPNASVFAAATTPSSGATGSGSGSTTPSGSTGAAPGGATGTTQPPTTHASGASNSATMNYILLGAAAVAAAAMLFKGRRV